MTRLLLLIPFALVAPVASFKVRISPTRLLSRAVATSQPFVDIYPDSESLKKSFFSRYTGLNRGFNAREKERQEVLLLVEDLESFQISNRRDDDDSEELTGTWRLIFTTALDVLSLGVTPFVEIGQIYQNIALDEGKVENVIEVQPKIFAPFNGVLGSTVTKLVVRAESSLEKSDAIKPVPRIRIAFASVTIEGVSVFGNSIPDIIPSWLRSIKLAFPASLRGDGGDPLESQGYFDTTYVDQDLRISRGNNGALFVLVRET